MSVTIRRRAVSVVAALALAVPAVALSATTANAAAGGFSPVATVAADQLVSPADGVAYTAQTEGTSLTRWTTSGSETVALPAAAGAVVDLTTAGGVAYALTTTEVVGVTGTTVTSEVPLPTTIPAPLPWMTDPTYGFSPKTVAVDESGVYVQGWAMTAFPVSVVLRWDGSAWTRFAVDGNSGPRAQMLTDIVRHFGVLDGVAGSGSYSTSTGSLVRWDGTQLTSLPGTNAWRYPGSTQARAGVTFASATDYTTWGSVGVDITSANTPVPVPPVGSCRHTVDGTTTACPAPAWPVSAAVRLADGRVVLGGDDAGTTPGAFAVVGTQDAVPADVPGDNGDGVLSLAAAPTGSTVWALTDGGASRTLQVADLAPAPTPTPTSTPTTPVPTSTPTTTPTATPTTPVPTSTSTPRPTPTRTPHPTPKPHPTHPAHPAHPHA